ncbi:DUF1612 domain-containing protein [Mesorhizobium sp.]|uniref:DUF1612 domain-containing protein n=1 Tax=Mesorhizobium sp. TaxID=1871066 RepID=UPI000FE61302|nr:DUF1612 domain-containing protein [Mesorhizobium sp.]RWP94229.1 MAG: DUF1612 domain-containing protein [Mesorhizobium sp.]
MLPRSKASCWLDAWSEIEVLQRGAWLGSLLVATLLRYRSSPPHHLSRLHLGAKNMGSLF